MAAQPSDGVSLWNFEEGRKDWQRSNDPLPVVAIPTTAGTGSETGRSTVVLNEDSGVKVIISHPQMMPAIVIADPELTLGLPRDITAATGMDALAHCLEAYCSRVSQPDVRRCRGRGHAANQGIPAARGRRRRRSRRAGADAGGGVDGLDRVPKRVWARSTP